MQLIKFDASEDKVQGMRGKFGGANSIRAVGG